MGSVMPLKSCAPLIYSRSLGICSIATHFITDIFFMVICQSKFKRMQGKCLGVAISLITSLGLGLVVKHKIVVSCIAI